MEVEGCNLVQGLGKNVFEGGYLRKDLSMSRSQLVWSVEGSVEVGRREDICLIGRGISKGKGLEVKGSYVYLRN